MTFAGMSFQVDPFNNKLTTDITNESTDEQKVMLFRSLFRGREDVFPKRFESKRTGKSGYQPVCRNEWIRPFCQKPKIRCGDCKNRDFIAVANEIVRTHLIGFDPRDRYQKEFVWAYTPCSLMNRAGFWLLILTKGGGWEMSKHT